MVFRGETIRGVEQCRLFSQATFFPVPGFQIKGSAIFPSIKTPGTEEPKMETCFSSVEQVPTCYTRAIF